MHTWGDKDVDWAGIEDAAEMIHDYCVKRARLGGQYKEKWGTVRFYAQFGLSLHSLVYPGHCFNRFPSWLWKLDLRVITPVLNFLFGKLWAKWQARIYAKAYKRAIEKYPHLKEEILCCADYPEILEKYNVL